MVFLAAGDASPAHAKRQMAATENARLENKKGFFGARQNHVETRWLFRFADQRIAAIHAQAPPRGTTTYNFTSGTPPKALVNRQQKAESLMWGPWGLLMWGPWATKAPPGTP